MTPTQQIKDKLDIVEFIRSYVQLLPAGKNFRANCPFHKEKTPSFMVSPERQTWHCFGSCAEGGDIFKFLMKYENIEFAEALKILAEKAGIELRKISPAEYKQFGALYEINDSAKNFFKKELANAMEVRQYLKERGLKQETIEEFDIGWAGPAYDNLTVNLINNFGYDVRDIERAGLNFKTERGGYIDRFRNRIMFPIYNSFGKVVGFSGRILPKFDTGETGKYINSPETAIFNKSKVLYGFHKSKNFIREEKVAVLMEGQMDFLMSWQDGVKNAAATSGTALTDAHLEILRRQTENVIFCFDNDEAGLKAAERSIDLANSLDFNVKILILEGYKDPAEAAVKAPGKLQEMLKNAKPAMGFYFDRYLGESLGKPREIGEIKKNLRIVLGKIKNLTSPVEQAHWLRELAIKANIKEEVLVDEMKQFKIESRLTSIKPIAKPASIQPAKKRADIIAEKIINYAVSNEKLAKKAENYFEYLPDDYCKIIKSLIYKEKLEDERLAGLLNIISLKSSFELQNIAEEKIEEEFDDLLKHLKIERLKERKNQLIDLIKEAEKSGDEEKTANLLKKFDEVSKMIHNK